MLEPTPSDTAFEAPLDNQRFRHGSVTLTEHEMGMDVLVVPMLDAKIGASDFIIIPGDQPENPNLEEWGGRRAIAELELGVGEGRDGRAWPAQKLLVLKMDPDFKQTLGQKVGVDFEGTVGSDGFLLVAFEEKTVSGFAFVGPQTYTGVVGRHTSLAWLNQYGKKVENSDGRNWS